MAAGEQVYTSPERVHGTKLGPPADVFSLGATLYAAVEGRPPFDNSSPAASLAAVLHDPPRPFQRMGPLWPIIQGMLVKEPRRRTALEQVWLALQAVSTAGAAGRWIGGLLVERLRWVRQRWLLRRYDRRAAWIREARSYPTADALIRQLRDR